MRPHPPHPCRRPPQPPHPERLQDPLLQFLRQRQQARGRSQPRLGIRSQQHGEGQPILQTRPKLLGGGGTAVLILVASIVGFGGGATLYMIVYLTTQYGGLRHFGKIYGTVSIMTGLSAGVGPITAGIIVDTTGNYELFLVLGIPVFIVAGLLVAGLGPFPAFEPETVEPTAGGPARAAA